MRLRSRFDIGFEFRPVFPGYVTPGNTGIFSRGRRGGTPLPPPYGLDGVYSVCFFNCVYFDCVYMVVFLNIGSNCGDRLRFIEMAVERLRLALPGRYVVSKVFESEPWGFESANRFMNVGVGVRTEREYDPLEVLEITQGVQRGIDDAPHRDASGGYVDRTIDIDIIMVDDVRMVTPRLTLPHPRMGEREFVMVPLMENMKQLKCCD